MRFALIQLGSDFLSTIVFLVAYFLTRNLYVAVPLSMAVGIIQLAVLKRQGRQIDVMPWLSLTFVLALGGAALITQDSRFIMAKPSIIHFAIGIVMLRRGWMGRYMASIVTENVAAPVLVASGYAWAAFMIAIGLLNLFVATHYSIEVWAWFISVGTLAATFAAFLLQYLVFRMLIRRRLRSPPS